MSNPLPALQLVSPIIATGATTLSIDADALQILVNADPSAVVIDVLLGTNVYTLTSPTLVNSLNQFTGSIPVVASDIPYPVQITGQNFLPGTIDTGSNALTPTISFELLYQVSSLAVQITAPTGVSIGKNISTCSVECVLPNYTGFNGIRVQWSTDASGLTVAYQQYGGLLSDVTRSAQVALGPASTATANVPTSDGSGDSVVTTTSTSIVATVNFTSVSIPATTVNADTFYVILTTQVTDPTTGQVYESQAAGPFLCGFVNLNKVNPTDFLALQKSTDIATRIIAQMSRSFPDLDLTAHADLRDLLIAPFALEIANQSIREAFARWSQSISAISQVDDANGDGISDSFTSSPLKQQIALAFGLSPTDTQTYISSRFDVLGEGAGVERGGATASTVMVTFYTYARPTVVLSIPLETIVSTIPNSTSTTAVTFQTTAAAVIDPTNLNSYYDAVNGWWGVQVPAQCQTAGSIGEVGARTITQVTGSAPTPTQTLLASGNATSVQSVSGAGTTLACINLLAAENGTDAQSNSDYAVIIQARQINGKDDSSRDGYLTQALETPGIVGALVVAAGDTEMLRDWDPIRAKHVFGCVDIYAQGNTQSQQVESVPFEYATTSTQGVFSTYLTLTPLMVSGNGNLSFTINHPSSLTAALYTAVEMPITSAGRVLYLGVANAQFVNVNHIVFLDPNEIAFTNNPDGSTSQVLLNGIPATNLAVIQSLGTPTSITYQLMARYQTGIVHVPALQPIISIDSITGPITGLISPDEAVLYRTNDFLLTGGSNAANDTIEVAPTLTNATTATLTIATAVTTIDSNMDVPIDGNGNPINVLSVRSLDLSTLYFQGTDYSIVAAGQYQTYALNILTGSAIAIGTTQVVVAYNKFLLNENVSLQTDSLQLNSTTAVPLSQMGFIDNVWLPVSHGITTLLLDGYTGDPAIPATGLVAAGVLPAMRYIKATIPSGAVANEGSDFLLVVDPTTLGATIQRVPGGQIVDGSTVTVTYFYAEVFDVASEYPDYVQQLALAIGATADAGAKVLVKAMVANPVDVALLVNLNANTTPDAVDGPIRTAISMVLNNAETSLQQSSIVAAVQQVNGVTGVQLPLITCAKADGSYDIGIVVPTGTAWTALGSDPAFSTLGLALPANCFITASPVLEESTIPSGGLPNAYVGVLYEGQSFRRALTVADFLTSTVPSFYIVGANDFITASTPFPSSYEGKILMVALSSANPTALPYFVTAQVFGQSGAQDLTVSATELLTAGTVNILYSS
jgi:hypothetical protein